MTRLSRLAAQVSIGAAVLVMFPASPAFAQVWFGDGVHVRAPFVRVDVFPGGGVSVRAPFAAVDVPPDNYYYGPEYPPPMIVERPVELVFPSAAELATTDEEQLNNALRTIAASLHNGLNRFDTSESWQQYFALPDAATNLSLPADERSAAQVALLNRLQKTAADPRYAMIARLPAFVAMEAALNEAVSRPAALNAPANNVEDLPLPLPKQPTPPQATGPQLPAPEKPVPPQQSVSPANEDPFLQPKPRQ